MVKEKKKFLMIHGLNKVPKFEIKLAGIRKS